MKEKARVAILAVSLAVLLVATAPSYTAKADSSPDYAVPRGHFYTQTNGFAAGTSQAGFSITDEGGIPFWSTYRNLGGPDVLGYPISRRFTWVGFVCQATQKAILQWDAGAQAVRLVNVVDFLSSQGKDEWLRRSHLVPAPLSNSAEAGLSFDQVQSLRLKLLEANQAFRAYYYSVPNPLDLFGLPTSGVVDLGAIFALRTQRTAFFQCKGQLSWCQAGEVKTLAAGDLFKEAGFIPREATVPEDPATRYAASSRGGARDISGLATWYGWSFQGSRMRNGELYDMWDPTTAACNVYPLETLLRVTNLDTGESIIVRVTDTGAFGWPIVVDLSYAAFARLADPSQGRMNVSIQPVEVRN